MKMLQCAEVGNISVQLHAENVGHPFWLIVTKGREMTSKIFDDRAFAEKAFDRVAMDFSFEHLKEVVGDQDHYLRILTLLNKQLKDSEFLAAVKNSATREPALECLLEESEALA
jgi:hypothetical protein